ncbi:MAG: hypothetical protein KGL39_07160 [Patescibacteria group bacterium]|nr:hypothetical protein [Patescibacteria group bacterium]
MNGEGFAYFYWHRRRWTSDTGCALPLLCREEFRREHTVIPAPVAPKREKVGWFIPNSSALIQALRNIQRTPGKRIHCQVLDNGPVEFFAEDI